MGGVETYDLSGKQGTPCIVREVFEVRCQLNGCKRKPEESHNVRFLKRQKEVTMLLGISFHNPTDTGLKQLVAYKELYVLCHDGTNFNILTHMIQKNLLNPQKYFKTLERVVMFLVLSRSYMSSTKIFILFLTSRRANGQKHNTI